LVEEQVLHPFDHRNLSADSAAFQHVVPTTENLAGEIFRRLKANWKSAFPGPWPVLDKIRIAETPRNIFEVSETNAQT
jgi:6-pyruvoyl-tetrahydropterin synthase